MIGDVAAHADLRRLLGPARDQGTRPTCLAFAVSDAHGAIRRPWSELSVEFLYYHAQALAGRHADAGSTPSTVMTALRDPGQPLELDWPYLAEVPEPATEWRPPPIRRRYGRAAEFLRASIEAVTASLARGRPPVLVVGVTGQFYSPDGDGVVHHADGEPDGEVPNHAVVAVGLGALQGEATVLVRNSWGRKWGLDGHAWLTGPYLRSRLLGVLSLKEDVDVSRYSPAA